MLALGKSIGRQPAHDIIYEAAMQAFEERLPFEEVLNQNADVTAHLDPQTITDLLDPVQYTGLSAVFVDRCWVMLLIAPLSIQVAGSMLIRIDLVFRRELLKASL